MDELGGLQAALDDAAKRANLEAGKYGVHYVEKPLSPFEEFVVNMGGSARGQGLLRLLAPSMGLVHRETIEKLDREVAWLERRGRTPFQAVAHCLCAW